MKLSIVRFRIELRSYLSKCFLGRLLQPYFCRWNSGICNLYTSLFKFSETFRWNLLRIFSVFIWWTLLCEYLYTCTQNMNMDPFCVDGIYRFKLYCKTTFQEMLISSWPFIIIRPIINLITTITKIPSKMDVAPRYKLLTLLTPLALLTWLPLLTLFKLSTLLTLFILLKLLHCTMCTLYSTIALWSKPEIQKPLSQNKNNIFEVIFPILF